MTQPNDAPSDGNKKPSSETADHEDVARLVDEAILGDEEQQQDQPKVEATSPLLQLGVNDEANASAVTLLYPDEFAFTESHGWLHYTDGHWASENAEAAVERAVVDMLKTRVRDALDEDAQAHEKLIKFCTPNSARVKGTVYLLRSKVAVSQSLFDVEPDLLNCPNGVVDLRTGELLPHDPGYHFMHMAGVLYDRQASSAIWEDWLTETVGDQEVARYLQLAAGYTLTGLTSEEVVFYIHGPPRSGKGIFTETLRRTLGEQLAKVIPFSVLTAKADVDSQNFALAPLKPTRLVLASESNQYERFNEAKLKSITGGDAISCSFKHRDAFTYRPQFKVWVTSNQPIRADPDDDAVWSRIRLLHFPTSHLGREDKTLKERIQANLPGVLAWAVRGAVDWYRSLPEGLPELPSMAEAKDDQRSEMDFVQQWIDECCLLEPSAFTTSGVLYESYASWCKSNGVIAKQQSGLSASLRGRGLKNRQGRVPGRVNSARGFIGIRLVS